MVLHGLQCSLCISACRQLALTAPERMIDIVVHVYILLLIQYRCKFPQYSLNQVVESFNFVTDSAFPKHSAVLQRKQIRADCSTCLIKLYHYWRARTGPTNQHRLSNRVWSNQNTSRKALTSTNFIASVSQPSSFDLYRRAENMGLQKWEQLCRPRNKRSHNSPETCAVS